MLKCIDAKIRRDSSYSVWMNYLIAPLLYFEDYRYVQHIFSSVTPLLWLESLHCKSHV